MYWKPTVQCANEILCLNCSCNAIKFFFYFVQNVQARHFEVDWKRKRFFFITKTLKSKYNCPFLNRKVQFFSNGFSLAHPHLAFLAFCIKFNKINIAMYQQRSQQEKAFSPPINFFHTVIKVNVIFAFSNVINEKSFSTFYFGSFSFPFLFVGAI